MTNETALQSYLLHLADNAHVLGHRLGEWCGHGPVLEQDIALTNISLDQLGLARMLYQYYAQLQNEGKTEDDIAFLRDSQDFKNNLLVEQPNGHWGHTIVRQFFHDTWHLHLYRALSNSSDTTLAGISERTAKEVAYHYRFSSEWLIRLGDGTEESHAKMQEALDDLWTFQGEQCVPSAYELVLIDSGLIPNHPSLVAQYHQTIAQVIAEATLTLPTKTWMQSGGKTGKHTEHLGYVLAEMQFMQRAYPNSTW